jgi:hypothetical protein
LFSVILAHVSPPQPLRQLRSFDVILMVIVAGISFSLTPHKPNRTLTFLRKRIVRLIAPTWTFLAIYFFYFFVIGVVTNSEIISGTIAFRSLLLLNFGGIGYVWIIRVFVLVALATPILSAVDKRLRSNWGWFSAIFIIMAVYCLTIDVITVPGHRSGLLYDCILEYGLYLVPYSLIFAIGMRLPILSNLGTLFLISLLGSIFLIILNSDASIFYDISQYKYPPRYVWLVYGLLVSVLLYKITEKTIINSSLVLFISTSTIWIYLWHIFILKNWSYAIAFIPEIANYFIVKLVIVFSLSVIITWVQKKVVLGMMNLFDMSLNVQKLLNACFLK